MIGSFMKIALAVIALGSCRAGSIRTKERAIYQKAFCQRQRSMEAEKSAGLQEESLDEVKRLAS